jgi:hypothetical protein
MRKPKDRWDVVQIFGPLISALFVAGVGWWITSHITHSQIEAAKTSADAALTVSKTQLAADYLNKIITAKTEDDRARLLSYLDIALAPDAAIPIALRFSYWDMNPGPNQQVANSALDVLRRITSRPAGHDALVQIANGFPPPSPQKRDPIQDIANALLHDHASVFVHISDVDDQVQLHVVEGADKQYKDTTLLTVKYGDDDRGWVDITSQLPPNGGLTFILYNEVLGCRARFQLSAGVHQFDYPVGFNKCIPYKQPGPPTKNIETIYNYTLKDGQFNPKGYETIVLFPWRRTNCTALEYSDCGCFSGCDGLDPLHEIKDTNATSSIVAH